jgi:hypothetical protein
MAIGILMGSATWIAGNAWAGPMLKMAQIEVDTKTQVKKLARMGIDIAAVRPILDEGAPGKPPRYRVDAVLSSRDYKKLDRAGLHWQFVERRLSASQRLQASAAPSVYHSFDESDTGIKAQLEQIAQDYPALTRLETIGYSIQQRPILAMRLTKKRGNWRWRGKHHKKPEVLYLATHHAREWVAAEMAMRLIKYFTANYGTDERVTRLLDTTKIWVVPVANPDGYQYTFDVERLWRKNLADNDNDGEITIVDGVDLNRNFASKWGLDDEGSSPVMSDATYRGPAPHSEPETQVVEDFVLKHDFKFLISYHTYSNLILYPWGWQVRTPSHDDPIFVAQAGTDDNPAIFDTLLDQGYDPGVGADLYTTNGDFTDWTYTEAGIPSYVVELTFGEDSEGNFYGFEFPDDEQMVQTVFEDNLEFALSLAESAADPAHPVSSVGITVEDIYHEPLTTSYGLRQTVDILARKKKHGNYWLLYTLNGRYGWSRFSPMLGEFYNENPGVHYCRYHARIKGQRAGDDVTYWIIDRRHVSGPHRYTVAQANDNPVLLLSAEDYTGQYPDSNATEPVYLGYYEEALNAAGIGYDVWDVTAKEAAPAFREVLSNYDAVVWYTGDDYAATVPGPEVHEAIVLGLRDFMNYSKGTLMASGQDLMVPAVIYGLLSDDFFQYNLGAYLTVDAGGISGSGEPFPVQGEAGDPIFDGLSFNLSGDDSAGNQRYPDTFLATSYFLPHFDNAVAARYQRPGGPFDPHGGDFYIYSQMADQAYKRLGGEFTVPEDNPSLSVWISFDIETDWDYAFVEIREAGTDRWTTLPDENELTVTDTGDSCASGWVDQIHPHLAHYMDTDCKPTGTTGEWHALTGNSNGWKQMVFDLSAYAGKTVELYIAYVSDWATQNLGVFVDDVTVAGAAVEGFEAGLGDFIVTAPEANTPFNNWIRMESGGFAEGPVIRTPNSILMGFGFEAVDGEDVRAEIMDRVMNYLLE